MLDSPGLGKGIRERLETTKMPIPLTEDEGLAFFLDGNYSVRQYAQLRKVAESHNAQIYPSYQSIVAARNRCVPPEVHFSERAMEVNLQSLLCHVTRRVCVMQHDVIVAGAGKNAEEGEYHLLCDQ